MIITFAGKRHCQILIKLRIALVLIFTSMCVYPTFGQTPSDALMMKKGELCTATIFSQDHWSKYWEGKLLRENLNIGQFTKRSYNVMLGYGFSDRLNLFVNVPYVTTSATGGQMKGAHGVQDLALALKYQILKIENPSFKWSFFTSAGYSFPASSYLSDYMPFSLGLGTNEFSGRVIMETRYKSLIYLRSSFAYLHRTTTKAERDYYYAGQGYYTNIMDVPDVLAADIALGGFLFNNQVQVESSWVNQTSLSGDDIRRQNAPQPTNKMNVSGANVYVRYFPEFIKGWSIFTNYNHVLQGRNAGQSRGCTAGLTYQFVVKK